MAWYNPRTWFPKETGTQTPISAPKQVAGEPAPGTDYPTYTYVPPQRGTTTPISSSSTGTAGGTSSGSSQPTDASFTSGGDASGGGSVYDPATQSAQIQKPAQTQDIMRSQAVRDMERARERETMIVPGATGTGTGGLILMTPTEARKYKGTMPVWEVQSANTPSGMVEAIDIESKWTGSIPITSYKGGFSSTIGVELPKEIFEYNLANINIAKLGYSKEKEFLTDVKQTSASFQANPEAFRGATGFKETETGYELGTDYYKTLPSYKNYESYFEKYDDKGFLKQEEYNKYLKEARTSWAGLPGDVKSASRLSSYQAGTFKAGIGIAEGTINFASKLGVQTIDKTAEKNWYGGYKSTPFSFGTDIMKTPTGFKEYNFLTSPVKYTKELITERPSTFARGYSTSLLVLPAGYSLIKGGISNIQTYGVKTGLIESTSYFSPLRIAPQKFMFNPNEQVYTGKMKIYKMDKGIIKQTFEGKGNLGGSSIGGDLKFPKTTISSTQYFKTTPSGVEATGFGETTTINPYQIYVGGSFYPGSLAITKQTLVSVGSLEGTTGYVKANIPADFTGFDIRTAQGVGVKGDVYSRTSRTIDILKTPKGYTQTSINIISKGAWNKLRTGGVVKDISFTEFTFKGGKRDLIYGVENYPVGETDVYLYSPKTMEFKTKVQGTGKVYDLTKQPTFTTYDLINPTGKPSGSTPFGRTFGYSPQVLETPRFSGTKTIITPTTYQGTGLSYSDTFAISQYGVSQISGGISTPTQILLPGKLVPVFDIGTKQDYQLKEKQFTNLYSSLTSLTAVKTTTFTEVKSSVKYGQLPGITQTTKQAQQEELVTKQTSIFKQAPITITSFPTPTGWAGGGVFIPPIFSLGSLGFLGTKTYKGERKYKYTPSYEALVLGIKGKAPKGLETGARIRPITPGFSFFETSKGFNLPFLRGRKRRK